MAPHLTLCPPSPPHLLQAPPKDWTEQFLFHSKRTMKQFTASELAELVRSLTALKVKPGKDWVAAYLQVGGLYGAW
jgi:hypothetical protein